MDFVTKDGTIIETKTGGARLSIGQKAIEADVKAGKAVTPVGENAKAAGLEPGVLTKFKDFVLDRPL